MSEINSLKNSIIIKSALALLISTTYAIIRYNYFGNVSLNDIPVFVFNKAIALSIVIILGFSLLDKIKDRNTGDYFSTIQFLIIMHVIFSLALHGDAYFPKMYIDGKLTLNTGIATLSGTILVAGLFTNIIKLKALTIYTLIGIHVFFYGFKGWVTPENWHGSLPPITLVSFVIVMILFLRKLLKK